MPDTDKGLGAAEVAKIAKRHKRVLHRNIQGITKPAIRRLAHRGGVKRMSGFVYEEARSVLRNFLGTVVCDAIIYSEHRRPGGESTASCRQAARAHIRAWPNASSQENTPRQQPVLGSANRLAAPTSGAADPLCVSLEPVDQEELTQFSAEQGTASQSDPLHACARLLAHCYNASELRAQSRNADDLQYALEVSLAEAQSRNADDDLDLQRAVQASRAEMPGFAVLAQQDASIFLGQVLDLLAEGEASPASTGHKPPAHLNGLARRASSARGCPRTRC
eukprot:g34497.t1